VRLGRERGDDGMTDDVRAAGDERGLVLESYGMGGAPF
jgi:hypothetical protein